VRHFGAAPHDTPAEIADPPPTMSETQKPVVRLPDAKRVAASLSRITQTGRKLVSEYMDRQARQAKGEIVAAPAEGGEVIAKSFVDLAQKLAANPGKLVEIQLAFWKDYGALWERTTRRLVGGAGAAAEPVITPSPADRRFHDPQWAENAVFDFIKQSYLLTARSIHGAVASATGLDPHTAERVDFYTRQFVDALSPSNSIVLNPAVLKATLESGGENLVAGLANLLDDVERSKGQLQVRRQPDAAFALGKDLAATPGKVIFQNELMQLLQYSPSTEKVHERPLLIVPPWINKYYVVDLSARNSWVRWAVSQGFTVFAISWVNPDERLAGKNFEDYLADGPLAALDAIEKATGEHDVLAVGYCLGGTLLSTTLAYLAEVGDPRIKAATLFTTMLDFAEPGEVGVFIDEEQLQSLEKQMNETGYLDGAQMASAFTMIRANDLVWSFVVHNYLLGKDPMPFDVLYWGADATRMPAKMHSFYLRNMYQHNRLRERGGLSLLGKPIDLRKVDVPVYFLSAREDYVAPWKSTYAGTHLMGGPVRFVLGGSGHIAAVLNPVGSPFYGYATNTDLPEAPEEWDAKAERHQGSWWPDWLAWVTPFVGKSLDASERAPGGKKLPVIEDAPGSYVKVRY
jgi:polyhydroxyalkanoate synthase